MKLVRICVMLFFGSAVSGQGYLQPDAEQKIQLDAIEIQNGVLFNNHLQIQALNKIRTINELLRFKVNSSGNQDNNNAIGDTVFANQMIADHVEALYNEEKMNDSPNSYFKSSKPFLKYFYKDGAHFLSLYKKNFQISIDPLLYFDIGKEDSTLLFINRRGLRIAGSVDQRVFFHTDIIETQLSVPDYVHNYVDLYQTFPGAGLYKRYQSRFPGSERAYDFLISNAAVEFKASRHINVSLGHGTHFIGSGIRSMFLSDFSAPHFYLQINTNVWKLHYQNLFAELSPESLGEQGDHLIEKKYMAAHYLSMNITKNWNAGIFESVVFARRNGFELQYLNPVILYRFIEHSLGSPDNVFIGLHSNVLLLNRFSVYGQMLFDEFVLKEFFSSKGWWGNKYAVQLGCKYINAFGLNHLLLQIEYNQIRPYTYTFRDSISNYTQYHQALAHPLGANFKELIFKVHYQPDERWVFSSQWLAYHKGTDSTGINNGGNILLNYDTRLADYGNTTAQGVSNKVIAGNFCVSYRLFHRAWLDLNLNYRSTNVENSKKSVVWFSGGFRMNLDKLRFDF